MGRGRERDRTPSRERQEAVFALRARAHSRAPVGARLDTRGDAPHVSKPRLHSSCLSPPPLRGRALLSPPLHGRRAPTALARRAVVVGRWDSVGTHLADVGVPRLEVHRERALALAAALVDVARRVVEDAEHRHNPVRRAVRAADVRVGRADVVHRKADASGVPVHVESAHDTEIEGERRERQAQTARRVAPSLRAQLTSLDQTAPSGASATPRPAYATTRRRRDSACGGGRGDGTHLEMQAQRLSVS